MHHANPTASAPVPRPGLLARLRRDARGLAGVEFALVFPLLAMLFAGGFTLFEMFRFAERLEASTATVADIVSRQPTVDDASMARFHQTFAHLVKLPQNEAMIRITSIEHVVTEEGKNGAPDTTEMQVRWVYDTRTGITTTPANLPMNKLPIIAVDDSVLVVESWATGDTTFKTLSENGLYSADYDSMAMVRPRYVAKIRYLD